MKWTLTIIGSTIILLCIVGATGARDWIMSKIIRRNRNKEVAEIEKVIELHRQAIVELEIKKVRLTEGK